MKSLGSQLLNCKTENTLIDHLNAAFVPNVVGPPPVLPQNGGTSLFKLPYFV